MNCWCIIKNGFSHQYSLCCLLTWCNISNNFTCQSALMTEHFNWSQQFASEWFLARPFWSETDLHNHKNIHRRNLMSCTTNTISKVFTDDWNVESVKNSMVSLSLSLKIILQDYPELLLQWQDNIVVVW